LITVESGTTATVCEREWDLPFASVAREANTVVTRDVGVPVSIPVVEFKETPGGRDPEARLHVRGAAPPTASKRALATTPNRSVIRSGPVTTGVVEGAAFIVKRMVLEAPEESLTRIKVVKVPS
jgi:hypothetical protein